MGDVWDVVSSVQDAADAARDAQRRQRIGWWRAAVATLGVVWTAAGILPGIPAMVSINRWMKGRSRRPLVAMVIGLVTLALLAGLLIVGVFVLLFGENPTNSAVAVGRTGLAVVAAVATLWVVGRHLFRSPEEQEAVPGPTATPTTVTPPTPPMTPDSVQGPLQTALPDVQPAQPTATPSAQRQEADRLAAPEAPAAPAPPTADESRSETPGQPVAAAMSRPGTAEPSSTGRVAELRIRRDVVGLGQLMLDPDPWVRVEAADALGDIGDPAAFDSLIASIGSPCQGEWRDRARGAARSAMSRLGPPTSAQLRRLVDMGGSGPWEAVELIRQHGLADDPEVGLWYRAATGHWEGGDASRPEALALIVANLETPSNRLAAIEGLRAAGPAGIPHLVSILDRDGPDKPDLFGPCAEKNAYEALCALDDPAAREAAAAHFSRIAAGSLDEKVRHRREGLVAAGGEPALEALLTELADVRPQRRLAAAEALGRLGDPRAVPALEAVALHDDHRVVAILEQAPDSITDEFLREAMERSEVSHPVREAATAAITKIRELATSSR